MEPRGKKPGWNPRSAPGRGEDHLPTISPGEKEEGQRREEPGEREWAGLPREGERKWWEDWTRSEDPGPSLTLLRPGR